MITHNGITLELPLPNQTLKSISKIQSKRYKRYLKKRIYKLYENINSAFYEYKNNKT